MKRSILSTALAYSLGVGAFAQSPALPSLIQALEKAEPTAQLNILRGMNAGLKGQRNLPAPPTWAALYTKLQASPNTEVRQQAQALAVIFGGGGALDELRRALVDTSATTDRRRAALDSLVSARDAATLPLLLNAVAQAGPLRAPVLRALASYDDPKIPGLILGAYGNLASEEKRDALATLTMRAASARELLAAIDRGQIARGEISAPLARQLVDLRDPAIEQWLAKNWGAVRTTSAEKQKEIARFKAFLTPEAMQKGDASHGRAIFAQTCAICHTLFGVGQRVGPELPGAFLDIDYLLQNILDPNAVIGKDYQQTVATLKDGQTLIGIVQSEDGATLTLKSLAGPVTLQRGDIQELKVLEVSLMPEGLLTGRSETDVRDLFAYLGRHGQVPVLANAANANDFFNGTDLKGWIASSPKAWSVEHGEIVGRGSGDRAEFLVSDLAVERGSLTCLATLRGPGGRAELMIEGEEGEGGFTGYTILFETGKPTSLLRYREPNKPATVTMADDPEAPRVSIEEEGGGLRVRVPARQQPGRRSVFGFKVAGKEAQLRVRDLKLELAKE